MSKPARFTPKMLSRYLKEVAAEIHVDSGIKDDGSTLTKAEALARVLWDRALGYTSRDPDNNAKTVKHDPEPWAISLIYDRVEGKVASTPTADPDSRPPLTERVNELVRTRVNNITAKHAKDE